MMIIKNRLLSQGLTVHSVINIGRCHAATIASEDHQLIIVNIHVDHLWSASVRDKTFAAIADLRQGLANPLVILIGDLNASAQGDASFNLEAGIENYAASATNRCLDKWLPNMTDASQGSFTHATRKSCVYSAIDRAFISLNTLDVLD